MRGRIDLTPTIYCEVGQILDAMQGAVRVDRPSRTYCTVRDGDELSNDAVRQKLDYAKLRGMASEVVNLVNHVE
jgi:hypothetical protein